MKFKKLMAAGVASLTLLATSTSVVSAHAVGTVVLLNANMPAYNAKGKKIKKAHPFAKGDLYKILGTKKIKGKKFYRLTKKKYIIAKDSKLIDDRTIPPERPVKEPWQSKNLVDTLPSLSDQVKKALSLQGEDRLEADKEIASQLGMLNKNGDIEIDQATFEKGIQKYTQSDDSAKNWIENPSQQSIKDHDQQMKDEANKFGDFINNK